MASTEDKKTTKKRNSSSASSSSSATASTQPANKRPKPSANSSPTSSSSSSNGQNVRVVARLRPLSSKETSENSQQAIGVVKTSSLEHEISTCINVNMALAGSASNNHTNSNVRHNHSTNNKNNNSHSNEKTFEYDGAFGPDTTQQQLYQHTVGDLVRNNIFKGFNVTVMAYGQTGSGKTFTMGTEGGSTLVDNNNNNSSDNKDASASFSPPAESDGIIPRAVYDLFDTRRAMPHGQDRVTVEMSYLEIYNEEARDLLAESGDSSPALQIRDRPDGVYVQNLSTKQVTCPRDISDLMNQAALKRATASTAMNAVSSRSHAICTLHVTIAPLSTEQSTESDATTPEDDDTTAEMRAKLTLVDLAGSERIKRTGAEGKRLKEGININKGLFVLGQCVSALSELGQQGASIASSNTHIPYRDSKLTRLLQDSLGGNSQTVMVACVSPADSNVDESVNTLRYAQRTRNIQNSARRNMVATTINVTEVAALKRENQTLKLQLAQAQEELAAVSANDNHGMKASTMNTNCITSTSNESNSTNGNSNTSTVNGFDMSKLDTVKRLQSVISSLESKVEALEEQQQSTSHDVLEASMWADRWQYRYEQLATAAKEQGLTVPDLTSTTNSSKTGGDSKQHSEDTENNGMDLVARLRKEISDLKTDLHEALSDAAVARATAAAIVAGNGDFDSLEKYAQAGGNAQSVANKSDDDREDISDDEDSNKEEKLALTAALVEVSGGIEAKEAMVLQMNKESECMESMRCHFENAVKSLQDEVDVLSKEREELLAKVGDKTGKGSSKCVKSDDRIHMQKRVEELESRMQELRHKAAEHSKSLRLREAAERKCAQLKAEIQADKKRRVNLQKQLKEQASERRTEKKQAKKEAAKLLRDSNRLKVELEKVKNAAAKQAAVLRRKATEQLNKQNREAELHAKKIQQQEHRKHMAAMKANAKNKNENALTDPKQLHSSRSNSFISNDRKSELQEWLEQEIDTSSAVKETQEQIQRQKSLMDEAIAEKASLTKKGDLSQSTGSLFVDPPTNAIKTLDEEIEMRLSVIQELQQNLEGLTSASSSPRARSPSARSSNGSSGFFADLGLYEGLTKPEATAVFLDCFDRVLQLKKEIESLRSGHEQETARAIQAVLTKERRSHDEAMMKLKMDHSEAMMDLLNSTKGSIEQSVRLNSLNSVVDPEFQSTVEDMLQYYLQGCNKAGELLQGDLREVREAQAGMKQIVERMASGLQVPNSSAEEKVQKKKKKAKKRESSDSILDEIKLLEMDDADEDADNSDDSDWSPSNKTPGRRTRGRRSADSVHNDSKRHLNSSDGMAAAAIKLDTSMVSEEGNKESEQKEGGTANFSMDISRSGDGDVECCNSSEPSMNYNDVRVKDLKEMLRARGLLVSGVKTELVERLEEDDRERPVMTGVVDLTQEEDISSVLMASGPDDRKENAHPVSRSRRASARVSKTRGLQNRDTSRNAKASKGLLPSTPPQSTQKAGGWSTRKIASVRRSTIFNEKRPSFSSSSSPESVTNENEENVFPSSNKKQRKSSLKTLRARRDLGVQLGNGIENVSPPCGTL